MGQTTRQKVGLHQHTYIEFARLVLLPTCNGFTIKNTGTTNVVYMQDVITPGNSKAFGGNQDEVYEQNEEISFQVPAPPPAIITNAAMVTQKYFKD